MIRLAKRGALLTSVSILFIACSNNQNTAELVDSKSQTAKSIWPKIQSEVHKDPKIEVRLEKILSGMTLEQKVAQMIQPEIRDISIADMREYGFGSYLNGGGSFPNGNKHSTPEDWINLAEQMYQASIDDSLDGISIPTMWGTDAVHGHNNVIGATLFPHNIGLGAANNPELIEKIATITATEVMVTGIDWVFAPTVAVVRDDRWGRTYEGYSEDPEIVKAYSASIVRGLQGAADKDFLSDNRVISTVKHFLGDGGTQGGVDQGDNQASEQELYDIHAQGYVGGLTAGAQSVMASFNSWQGDKLHGNKYLLTDVLKNQMGFDGFIVGDWNGHGQVKGCTNDNCPQAVNAGLDIFMVPTDAWKPLYENTIAQVKSGEISQGRIDDAVRRILRVKLRAGLFEKPSPAKRQFSGKTELIGQKSHRDVAKQAVRESLVLLKNKDNILPLSPKLNVLVAGDAADNIGKQSGGWTITWQGTGNNNADFPGGSSIYSGIESQVKGAGGTTYLSVDGSFENKPDVAIVVFGEEPYAEGQGDIENLAYQQGNQKDLAILNELKAQGIPTVSVFISGRPLWVNAELNASDAFVAAWLPGSQGSAVAEVLFKNTNDQIQYDFKGRLSYSWPNSPEQHSNRFDQEYSPLFAYGYGLSYGDESHIADDLAVVSLSTEQSNQLNIFAGKLDNQWQMNLVSKGELLKVDSNTLSIGSIAYRTIDKNIQEDAFKVTTKGEEDAGMLFSWQSVPGKRLLSSLKPRPILVLNVKLETGPKGNIWLSFVNSAQQSSLLTPTTSLDIADKLKGLPVGQWNELSIDLSGVIDTAFGTNEAIDAIKLHTTEANSVTISEIYLTTK